MAVSQAVVTPRVPTPIPTPRLNQREFRMYSGSTVWDRCDHVALVPPTKMLRPTLATGSPASRATITATASSGECLGARMTVNANYNRPLCRNLN